MNKQEQKRELKKVFNKVKRHLLKQGKKSKRGGTCQYRGPGGTMCAIGCLIKDSAYSKEMEGATINAAAVLNNGWVQHHLWIDNSKIAEALNKSKIPAFHEMLTLLNDLQEVHDSNDARLWAKKLEEVKEEFGL